MRLEFKFEASNLDMTWTSLGVKPSPQANLYREPVTDLKTRVVTGTWPLLSLVKDKTPGLDLFLPTTPACTTF